MRAAPVSRLLRRLTRFRQPLLAIVFGSFMLAGCAGDRIVFRDRVPFNPPADAASGFLGYYSVDSRQTTCGNCHVDYQNDWRATKHAGAFASVDASPVKAASCYGCHTVTGKGNSASEQGAGYEAVAHPTYRDVQCESCHGPGLQHVEGVGQGTIIRPLAKLSMTGSGNCGDCHSGAHHPFVEDWEASGHANVFASRASNPSCSRCHDGRQALESWGVRANYVEKDMPTAYQATTCAVCHDPHGSPNTAQLRFSISTQDPAQNLCIRCHLRTAEPTFTSSSPHAPQGAVLLGTAGYRPPGFAYDTAKIFGSHATEANPRLCAGCHVTKYEVTDRLTGDFVFESSGHLMRPIPCLDANGLPTANKDCAYTATARSWQACTACHGNPQAAANAFNTARDRMKFFVDQLWVDLNGNGSLQAAPTDGGLLATVRALYPAEWSNTDNTITPAEGAEFNARLCGEFGQSTSDNSKGTHNPFLCQALLIASINHLQSHYALPAFSAELKAALDAPIGGSLSGSMRVSREQLPR